MNIYETRFTVASYHCDAAGRLRPDAFLHYCQEVAENHAHRENYGYDWGMALGLIWVMSQADVIIHRHPRWKEELLLRTYSGIASPLQARRCVQLYSADGSELLVEAELQWLLIDLRRRRPTPFKKIDKEFDTLDSSFTAPVPEEGWQPREQAPVAYETGWRDLDFHGHVNNASYLIWLLHAMPEQAGALRQFRIQFIKESMSGELLHINHEQLADSEDWTRHQISDEAGKPRATITCHWDSL